MEEVKKLTFFSINLLREMVHPTLIRCAILKERGLRIIKIDDLELFKIIERPLSLLVEKKVIKGIKKSLKDSSSEEGYVAISFENEENTKKILSLSEEEDREKISDKAEFICFVLNNEYTVGVYLIKN